MAARKQSTVRGGALKPCLERLENGRPCGVLSHDSRCPEHRRRYEKKKLEAEPWRWFYKDPRWSRARLSCLERDGWQCTFVAAHRRCLTTVPLEVHHNRKLRLLWEDAG